MFFGQKRKHTVSSIDWELQRQAYIQHTQSLNGEYEKFRKPSRTLQHTDAIYYTLLVPRVGVESEKSVVRLPHSYRSLRVFSGCAWVTYKAADFLLHSGEEMVFDQGSDDVVVSCVGNQPLNFHITR